MEGLSLGKAAEAVERGRVVEVGSGKPLRWEPAQLVIPVSAGYKALFDSPDYRKLVTRALVNEKFKLIERR